MYTNSCKKFGQYTDKHVNDLFLELNMVGCVFLENSQLFF